MIENLGYPFETADATFPSNFVKFDEFFGSQFPVGPANLRQIFASGFTDFLLEFFAKISLFAL